MSFSATSADALCAWSMRTVPNRKITSAKKKQSKQGGSAADANGGAAFEIHGVLHTPTDLVARTISELKLNAEACKLKLNA